MPSQGLGAVTDGRAAGQFWPGRPVRSLGSERFAPLSPLLSPPPFSPQNADGSDASTLFNAKGILDGYRDLGLTMPIEAERGRACVVGG